MDELTNRYKHDKLVATHQTTKKGREIVDNAGVILPNRKERGFRHLKFTGVNLGMFGCYSHWVENEPETYQFDISPLDLYPVFVNTHLPRVAATYPGPLSVDNQDVTTTNRFYDTYWNPQNGRHKEALLALYGSNVWELVDVSRQRGFERHTIRTDRPYLTTAALCDYVGFEDVHFSQNAQQ